MPYSESKKKSLRTLDLSVIRSIPIFETALYKKQFLLNNNRSILKQFLLNNNISKCPKILLLTLSIMLNAQLF